MKPYQFVGLGALMAFYQELGGDPVEGWLETGSFVCAFVFGHVVYLYEGWRMFFAKAPPPSEDDGTLGR